MGSTMNKKVTRLFEQFQPESYHLFIAPDATCLTFSGTVVIEGKKTGRPSKRIMLHQKGLNISSATIENIHKGELKTVPVDRVNTHASYDEVRLHAGQMVYPGLYRLTLEFSGTITEAMHGLYPAYFEHDGEKKAILATQFESHHAREVFPCIDEPEAKAIFDLSLLTPKGQTVLGNTPVKHESEKDGLIETTFETSPRMSTYLLAFAVGDLHCVEGKTKEGVAVRTWSSITQPKSFLNYANDEAVKVLDFFTEYFGTPFPLPKCDQLALPDFESGAMENWGLITYREIALLADPANRSLSSEQYVSLVVSHELSHQWFGNLVTMKWWDDLWLNESFASLMEYIALDALHPDWHIWEQYTASDVIACSSRDIYKDVQPVRVEVNHPDEILTLFDPAIVYAKGGRLLKMLREYIGDPAFRKGLQEYFTKHAYSNTTRDDLWAALGAASGKDIHAFMNPWLEQSGMPMLEVQVSDNELTLRQERFVLDAKNDPSLWPIPLLANQPLSPDVMTTAELTIAQTIKEPLVLNASSSGHYIVHYLDQALQSSLVEAFGTQAITAETRSNILNDLMLLARGGKASLTEALDITRAAAGEPRESVWGMMSRAIGLAHGLTEGDDATEKAAYKLRRELAGDWYEKLGWNDREGESANDILLRQIILGFMVGGEDPSALAETVKRYSEASDIESLPSEQRALILGAVVRHAKDAAVVDSLIAEYPKAKNPEVQIAICAGLTNTRDVETGKRVIEAALGEGGFVRPQDIFRWFAYLMRNRYTREATWDWLVSSWDRLEKSFGDSKSFDYLVSYSAGPLNTPQWQERYHEFFTPKLDNVALKRNIKVAFSEIEARVTWRQREEATLKAYFKKLS
jgi:aminopeptidase N